MKRTLTILTLGAVLLSTGCAGYEVPWLSLYPLYQGGDSALDMELAGPWYSNDYESERLVFRKVANAYVMTDEILTDGQWKETDRYDAFLLRLGDVLFIDLSASSQLAIRGHLFLKIRLDGNQLGIESLNDEWLRQQVVEQAALSYLDLPDSTQPITAPTRELRRFLLKYANDPDAFATASAWYHRRSP
ncbi:MAG: hypothetical protein ABI833_07760 [Acidobacteriota bacterium]